MPPDDEEVRVFVRLQGDDLEMFKAMKKKTKVKIDAEVLRVALRQYYEDRIQDTPKSTR